MAGSRESEVLIVIPARYASERFPGKVLAPLAGKPLVLHTYERACQSQRATDVVIATDDRLVQEELGRYGASVVMTRADHRSGTDRMAEVAGASNADIVVNVQGDEPLIDPATIDATILPLIEDATLQMTTARHPLYEETEIRDSNVVKVVCDARGRALYFSRSAIPYVRNRGNSEAPTHWQHIGIYGYRRTFLMKYAQMPSTPLERLECLEQLRVLEHGFDIQVVDTDYKTIGVDTPEDLARVQTMLEGKAIT